MFISKEQENMSLEERNLFYTFLINDYYHLHHFIYIIENNNIGFNDIFNNIKKVDNINSALILFSFIVQSNIEKKEEILLFLKNFILENVLSKKEQTISYLYLQVLIFCNYYNIDTEVKDLDDVF